MQRYCSHLTGAKGLVNIVDIRSKIAKDICKVEFRVLRHPSPHPEGEKLPFRTNREGDGRDKSPGKSLHDVIVNPGTVYLASMVDSR
jgi:hypothetical protein